MTKAFLSLAVLPLVFAFAFGQNADPGFPMYGNFAIQPSSFPGIVGQVTNFDVLLLNYGTDDTEDAIVDLAFNDWGVTYQGWQPIDSKNYDVLANDNAMQTFSYTFSNRAHTCIQATLRDPGTGGNTNENNDRTQINWEVVHADDDFDMYVPFGNGADEEIIVNGTEILCMVNGTVGPCFPGWNGEPGDDGVRDPRPRADAPGVGADDVLPANGEVMARVHMPFIPDEGLVVVLQAQMNGEMNHVMINVIKTTVEDLLNTPHLCCLESIKMRVMLESILADALDAYEAGDCKLALKLLRLFVQKAILLECDLTDAEVACIEKAILKIVDAGIMIARRLGTSPAKHTYIQEAQFFRRSGLYEAALLEASKAC